MLWVLGGWLFATLFMMGVAIGNFKVLKPEALPKTEVVYAAIPIEDRPLALKYAANELNRVYFKIYNRVQLGLAALAALLCFSLARPGWSGRAVRWVLLLCLALCLAFELYFIPTIIELGREIELMPRDPMPPEVKRFFMIHGINNVLELLKAALLLGASVGLILESRRIEPHGV